MNESIFSNYLADSISIVAYNYNNEMFVSLTQTILTILQAFFTDFNKFNTLSILTNIFVLIASYILVSGNLKDKQKDLNNLLIIVLGVLVLTIAPIRIRYSMEWINHSNWAFILLQLIIMRDILRNPYTVQYKRAFLLGIVFFGSLVENAYHGVEHILLSIFPTLYFVLSSIKKLDYQKIKSITINFSTILILYSVSVWYLYASYSSDSILASAIRSPSDRWAFSARPWHYLIPDIDHPIFGDLATKAHYFIWQHPPYYLTEPFFPKEHTLFLGYTLIALSIYTIWQTYVKKNITGDQKFNVTFFLIIAVTAFIFSMPPYIGIDNLKIYFPSHFIYDFLPQFRAYARYGVFVFIGNAVIAMIGLNYLISKSFINKPHQKFKQNILILLISVLAIFEFIPGKHLISILPTPPYEWLRMQASLQQTPLKYIEIPARADYTDHLYTYDANIEIINPYLTTRGDAKLIEKMIWDRDPNDKLFCDLTTKLNAKYLFYHEKELNRQKYVQEFMKTGAVTPQLKVAMAESWGQPVFGNHVPKTDGDLAKEQITNNMKNFLLHDPKLILIKEYTNDEITGSRPNKNFSADKFDAVTVFEINRGYCNSTTNP